MSYTRVITTVQHLHWGGPRCLFWMPSIAEVAANQSSPPEIQVLLQGLWHGVKCHMSNPCGWGGAVNPEPVASLPCGYSLPRGTGRHAVTWECLLCGP